MLQEIFKILTRPTWIDGSRTNLSSGPKSEVGRESMPMIEAKHLTIEQGTFVISLVVMYKIIDLQTLLLQ